MPRKREAQKAAGSMVPRRSTERMVPRGFIHCNDELTDRLCKAIKTHPNFTTACWGSGVAPRVAQDWIRRGTRPGCNPVTAEFAERFLQANSEHASFLYKNALHLALEGVSMLDVARSKVLFGEIHARYRDRDEISDFIDGADKRTDNLHALLLRPTPRLRAALERAGWSQKETVESLGESVEDD